VEKSTFRWLVSALRELLLEKNLSRFDSYINAVNTKAAFLVTFNTFTLGTLLLKHDVVLAPYMAIKGYGKIGAALFVLCILAIAIAILFSFLATSPFLKIGDGCGKGATLFFFESVAQMGKQAYSERLKDLSDKDILADLIDQTHILAIGVASKFEKIRIATLVTVFGTISSLFLSAVFRFIDWAAS